MTEVVDLPSEAQTVLMRLRDQRQTVFQLVDALAWGQTMVQQQLNALEKAGWIESRFEPDGNPAGGGTSSYTVKDSVREKVPKLMKKED